MMFFFCLLGKLEMVYVDSWCIGQLLNSGSVID